MRKTQGTYALLAMIFAVALIVANVVTAKLYATGLYLMGTEIMLPGAVLCYAITFLMTDVIGELWGKAEANRIVRYGIVAQLIASALIILTRYLPTNDPAVQSAYVTILGQNPVFVVGSLTAYACSQTWDVWLFHKIRARVLKNGGSTKQRWIWNNASTMTSQMIDTVIFIFISFGLGFRWAFMPEMRATLFLMMLGQYAFKFLLAALDTPFFYLLTRRRDDRNAI